MSTSGRFASGSILPSISSESFFPATESLGSTLKFCPDQKASGTVGTFGAVTGAPRRVSVRLEDGQTTPDSEVAAGCTVAF